MARNRITEDLTGRKFGKLTVLSVDERRSYGLTWKCKCDCGTIKSVFGGHLRRGMTKSCGCNRKGPKGNVKIGQIFGFLEVISIHHIDKWYNYHYLCKCECGNFAVIPGQNLVKGKTKSCGCWHDKCKWTGEGDISGCYLSRIKKGAKTRCIEYNISNKELWDLYIEQDGKCALSGIPIYFSKKYYSDTAKLQTASLDRIDNHKGYVKGNIHWIHKDINRMKNIFTEEEFLGWVDKIYNHKIKKV